MAVTRLVSKLGPAQVGSPISVAPATRRLQVAPNPFASGTVVRFELAREQVASVRIYDVSGRLVRTLVGGRLAAGSHAWSGDGRADVGRVAAAGVYWIRFESSEGRQAAPVVRLR